MAIIFFFSKRIILVCLILGPTVDIVKVETHGLLVLKRQSFTESVRPFPWAKMNCARCCNVKDDFAIFCLFVRHKSWENFVEHECVRNFDRFSDTESAVFNCDNRDSRHCCPDLHPGESSWSWTRCPLPRLGYGAQMEPSWLTWHGIWSQTQIFFWHSLKHLKQFQNVSENWNVDNVDVHSRSLSSSCARLCWSRHGNQDLDSAGWLEVGGREQSVLPFFFTFSSASLCCSRLWQALAEARVVICCDWFQNLRLQACAAGFGLPYPHTQNRREARFTCPLKLSLRDWLKGSILPSHCDFMFRSTYVYTVYIYIILYLISAAENKIIFPSFVVRFLSEGRMVLA